MGDDALRARIEALLAADCGRLLAPGLSWRFAAQLRAALDETADREGE